MGRPLRIEYPGAFYHIIQRGIERKTIFQTDRDKEKFIGYLRQMHEKYACICHSYVLMDNHYHLILETPRGNLSKVMHYLNTSYAVYFNRKRKRVGPLYQGRYKAILVESVEYLHYLSKYVHLNPVRAKIVSRPGQYVWSSYMYYSTNKETPNWFDVGCILSMFNNKKSRAREKYRQFVLNKEIDEQKELKENMRGGIILGREDFFHNIVEKYIKGIEDEEIPKIREVERLKEPSLKEINSVVKRKIGLDNKLSRKIAIYLSRKYTQNPLKDIASYFNDIGDAGVSILCKRVEARRQTDGSFNKLVNGVEKMLKVET